MRSSSAISHHERVAPMLMPVTPIRFLSTSGRDNKTSRTYLACFAITSATASCHAHEGFATERSDGKMPTAHGTLHDNFFFASSGTFTLVVPTSLTSTVEVRSTSNSLPLKSTLPVTLNSNLVSAPSLTQNFTDPLGLLTVPNLNCALAPSSVRSPEYTSPSFFSSLAAVASSAACAAGTLKFRIIRPRNRPGPSALSRSASDCQPPSGFV